MNAENVFVVRPPPPKKEVDEDGNEVEPDEEALKKATQPKL